MIEELFCLVDDFCQLYLPQWQTKLVTEGLKKRQRLCRLSVSELMTILIHFHQSNFRTFKHYCHEHILSFITLSSSTCKI